MTSETGHSSWSVKRIRLPKSSSSSFFLALALTSKVREKSDGPERSDVEPGARDHRMGCSGSPNVKFDMIDMIDGSDRLTGEARRDVPFCAAVATMTFVALSRRSVCEGTGR